MNFFFTFCVLSCPFIAISQTTTTTTQGSNNSAGGAYVAPVSTHTYTVKEVPATPTNNIKSPSTNNNTQSVSGTSNSGNGGSLFGSSEHRKDISEFKNKSKEKASESKALLKSFDYIGPLLLNTGGAGGYKIVSKDNKWGLIYWQNDKYVDIHLPLNYDGMKFGDDLKFAIKLGNKWGFVDYLGQQLMPIIYDDILSKHDYSSTTVVRDGKKYNVDTYGSVVGGVKTDIVTGAIEVVAKPLPGQLVDERDKKTYETIKIGQQIFMAQNLNVSLFRNGDPILEVKTIEEWKNANNLHLPASCTYNFDPANGIKYGKLYNWYAVSDSRGLAPAGWHVPKSEEWVLLSNELGGSGRAGNYMKSLSAWDLEHGLTKSGFHGLPGGYLNMNNKDGFTSIGTFGLWSTATEIDTEKSEYRYLEMDKTDLYNIKSFKHFGASVRCIKD